MGQTIAGYKTSLNTIDANYHTAKAAAVASGADDTEVTSLRTSAQAQIGAVKASFDTNYEKHVGVLETIAGNGEHKATPAKGTTKLATDKEGSDAASKDGQSKDDASKDGQSTEGKDGQSKDGDAADKNGDLSLIHI